MTRFYFTSVTAAGAAFAADQERQALAAHSPANDGSSWSTATVDGGANAALELVHWTNSEQPHGSADWPIAGYGVSLDVRSIGADLTLQVRPLRVSSDASTFVGGDDFALLSGATGTGIKTATNVNWFDVNTNSLRAATDRFGASIRASNSNMMASETVTIYTSDSDSWVEGTSFANGTTHQITASGSGTSGGSAAIQIILVHLLTASGSGTSGGSAAITAIRRLTATGSGTSGGSAAIKSTLAISASGSGTSGGSAALRATLQIKSTGSGTSGGSAAITLVGGGTTHQITATGSGTSGGSASITAIRRLAATGTGTSGGSAALSLTARMSASGSGSTGGSAALRVLLGISATGSGVSGGTAAITLITATVHQLSAEGSTQSGGSVTTSTFHTFRHYFSPPVHEEPIRSDRKPLTYFRLTHSTTVLRRDGAFIAMRTPPFEWLEGEPGKDFFIGGHEYEISEATKAELQAAGFSVTSI